MLQNNNIELSQVASYEAKVLIDSLIFDTMKAPIFEPSDAPEPGDHLVTDRGLYTHHGLYIGNDRAGKHSVIHYSGLATGLEAGPIEIVSLDQFCVGKGYHVYYHRRRMYSGAESIQRAKKRLAEEEYNLVFNNCEHFVNHCINGVPKSAQSTAWLSGFTRGVKGLFGRSAPVAQYGVMVHDASKSIRSYLKGDIDEKKLTSELSALGVTSTAMAWYGALGQVAIPVPVVGAMVGTAVGYFVGNALFHSGHIALGETAAVKASAERRERILKMCELAKERTINSRVYLQKCMDEHFPARASMFKNCFDQIDQAILTGDDDAFINSLEAINNAFGNSLHYKSFKEFDKAIKSGKAIEF